ncbi:tape measure protein [uncultured Corynebacterium sp.]|uniref:tape measure protein n=1 Tax=uncultured Corynebacterium sp. TaxID=159447 RepID=UPI0025FD17D1|nr:tape measure protein [uncultured Corynebacterium sp.]
MAANFDVGTGWVSIVPKMGDFSQIRKQLDKAVVAPSPSWGEQMGNRITSGLKKTMKVGAVAVTVAAGVSAGKAFSDGFSRLASTDRAEKALEGLGYKGNEITQIMGNVNKSIEGTSFLMGDTAQVASVMLGSGIKPGQELQDTLSHVADAAAHSNTSIGEMGSIWSKVAARGHLDGEVMNQLMYHGIGVQEQLAKQMGVSRDAIADMVSSGKISFADFSQAMDAMFHGAAQKQRETFQGSMDYMKAIRSHVTAEIIQPFYKGMIPVFNAISDGFAGLEGRMGPIAQQISNAITPVFEHLANDVIPSVFSALDSVNVDAVMGAFGPLKEGLAQMGPLLEQAGKAAIDVVAALAPAIPPLAAALVAVVNGTLPALTAILNALVPTITSVIVPAITMLGNEMAKHPALAGAAASGFMLWAKAFIPLSRGFKAVKAGADIMTAFGPRIGTIVKSLFNVGRALKSVLSVGRIIFTGLRTLPSLMSAIFSTNPVGVIITAIGLLIAGITLFLTKTQAGQAILESVGSALQAFWGWLQPIFEAIGSWLSTAWSAISSFFSQAASVISTIVPYVVTVLLTPIMIQVEIVKAAILLAFNVIKAGWDLLVTGIVTLWEAVLHPAWDLMGTVISTLWSAVLQPIFSFIGSAWNMLLSGMAAIWNGVLLPAWNLMGTVLQALWNGIVQPIFTAMGAVWSAVVNGIKAVIDNVLLPAWHGMSDLISNIVDNFVKPAFDRMGDGVRTVQHWFESAADGIKKAWNSVWDTVHDIASKIANIAYSNGIRPAWNAVAKATGVGDLPSVKFATGGVMPGYTPGRDVHTFFSPTAGVLNLSGGEAVMRPEWTRAVGGPAAVARMNAMARSGRGSGLSGAFADGGVIGGIKHAAGKAWEVTDDVLDKAMELGGDFANAAKRLFFSKIDGVKGQLGISRGTSLAKSVAPRFLTKGADNAWNWLKEKVSEVAKKVKERMSVGGNVEMYRGLVERLLREKGQPVSLTNSVLRRMQQESGGNPHAVNNWDSNAAKGTPSKGLMQTIDPTFQSYKDAGFDDIWDPESNIRASMNYAMATYGSLSAAYDRAGGYKRGGVLPAFLRDSGGVLPNNSIAVNTSGDSEWVLSSQQMQDFAQGMTEASQHMDETAQAFADGVEAWLNGEEDRIGAPIEWGAQFLGDILSDVTEDLGSPWGIDGTKAPDILDNQGRVKVSVAGPADDPGRSVLPPVEVHVNMNGDNMTVSSDDVRRGVNQALADYQRRIEALERGVQINTFTTPMVV